MNIQQFQYILAVSELKHFEKAAQKCFVTQSTLSTMISKFEEEINIQIFDRKVKPVEITKNGEEIIKQIRAILSNINELNELVKDLKGESKSSIKVGCIPTVAPFILPLFLQEFSARHPSIYMEVKEQTTEEIIRQLKNGEIEIGIVSTPLNEPDLIEHFLYEEDFVLYDLDPKTEQDKLHLKEMDLDNFWLLEEGHCMRNQVLKVCEVSQKQLNPNLNINYKAGSIDSLIRFVKINKGKTLLPYLATIDFNDAEKKKIQYFEEPAPSRSIGFVVHKHLAKTKILRLLKDEITNKINPILRKKSNPIS